MNKQPPREPELHDYDRDRYGYDHPASATRRHGHHCYADEARDSWQGFSPTYDPMRGEDDGSEDAEFDDDIELELETEDDAPTGDALQRTVMLGLASLGGEARAIDVFVTNGEVLLLGTVSTREAKYEAERLADEVRGVRAVLNQLRVRYGDA